METSQSEATPKNLEAIDLVMDAAGRLFEHWGYRAIVGRTWAQILLSAHPLDAAALRETLHVSSGALSMSLKELVDLGLVFRESVSGKRRYFYRAETDFWVAATRVFQKRERKRFGTILEQIKSAERILASESSGANPNGEDAFQLEQVRHLLRIGEFIVDLLDAVMGRTKVELKAAQKWLSVSGKIGGEPLSRIRRAINASRLERKRQ